MKNYITTLTNLNDQLEKIKLSAPSQICGAEKSIQLISNTLIKLREEVLKRGFKSKNDEIHFFKELKPQIFSKLIFFKDVLEIEIKRSFCRENGQNEFVQDKIEQFQKLFRENIEFMRYYRNQSTHLDDLYYLRKVHSSPVIGLNPLYFTDLEFSTSHDQLVTSILAFEHLTKYLKNDSMTDNEKQFSNLYWSESKVALVELIYALHHSGSICNGKSDIKQLCGVFEKIFNIELDEIYRIFISIRRRKSDITRFMDKITMNLSNHINELEK